MKILRRLVLYATVVLSINAQVGEEEVKCAPGRFHNVGGSCTPCNPGTYSSEFGSRSCLPCRAGFFGKRFATVSEECDGPCPNGFYCPQGTIEPKECGGNHVYCPLGAAEPLVVPKGYYSVHSFEMVQDLGNWTRDATRVCEPGFYCENGVKIRCPKGTYCQEHGASSIDECVPAPLGSYASSAAAKPTKCPPGRFGNVTGLSSPECSGTCEPGFYCPRGSRSSTELPCPGGVLGHATGLTTASCSSHCSKSRDDACVPEVSICPPGFFCPESATVAIPCGNASVFCPRGSAAPQVVSSGYYSIDGPADKRQGQRICEKGFYCENGIRTPCPAGTFGESEGLDSPSCSGLCSPGFFCKQGSTTKYQFRCGAPENVCPEGSPKAFHVQSGYFGSGMHAHGDVTTHSQQDICPQGHYCTKGLKLPCPAGTFGEDLGLSDASCSSECPKGHYCPRASVRPIPCPAGTYGAQTGLKTASCSGPCKAGYYCVEGSETAEQYICDSGVDAAQVLADSDKYDASNLPLGREEGKYYGEENGYMSVRRLDRVFCPMGSGQPIQVTPGFFAAGGRQGARTHEISCQSDVPNQWDRTICDSVQTV